MKKITQLCYTDETLGEQMLVTFIAPNQKRDLHMISTSTAVYLKDNVCLLKDSDGVTYISYRALGRTDKKVYIGWSSKEPMPGNPLNIRGFAGHEIDLEILDGIKPEERCIHLQILRSIKGDAPKYGNVWIVDAKESGEDVTAVIQLY